MCSTMRSVSQWDSEQYIGVFVETGQSLVLYARGYRAYDWEGDTLSTALQWIILGPNGWICGIIVQIIL